MSGKIFVDCLLEGLHDDGWRPMSFDQSVLCKRYTKTTHRIPGDDMRNDGIAKERQSSIDYDDVVTTYVDDVFSEHEEERGPWSIILDRFPGGPGLSGELPHEHLGQVFKWATAKIREQLCDECRISMTDYIRNVILDTYECGVTKAHIQEHFKRIGFDPASLRDTYEYPAETTSDDLRISVLIHDDSEPVELPIPVLRFIQEIVGQLLWASRCGRWDISYIVSILSSRFLKWTIACWRALYRVIGYLRKFPNLVLLLRAPRQVDIDRVILCNDGDSDLPCKGKRPRFGCLSYITYEDEIDLPPDQRTLFLPIDFITKSASLNCDSTGGAETVAMHGTTRKGLDISLLCGDLFHRTSNPAPRAPVIRGDNSSANTMSQGASSKLAYLGRAFGIRGGFVHDLVRAKVIDGIRKVHTSVNAGDFATKPWSGDVQCLQYIGLVLDD